MSCFIAVSEEEENSIAIRVLLIALTKYIYYFIIFIYNIITNHSFAILSNCCGAGLNT